MSRAVALGPVGVAAVAAVVALTPRAVANTRLTIQGAASSAYGGLGYGGFTPLTGATITQLREVEIDGKQEIRLTDVAATLDPGSVQLRDRTDPDLAITEQRFVPGAVTPTEILARSIGEQIVVTTPKGQVAGTLRAVDPVVIVVETAGADRRLAVLRRDYVLDLRIANGASAKPTLVWRVATKQPGKHSVEVTYRAEGLSWTADYLAVLDDAARTIDFSAWAHVKNASGTAFQRAELTLVSGAFGAPSLYGITPRPPTPPSRYPIAQPVTLGAGESVQVELVARKVGAKYRSVVAFEAMPDPSASYQGYPNTDCAQFNGVGMGAARADLAAELDVGRGLLLPEGRVRVFKRASGRNDLASEELIVTTTGAVRIRLDADADILGERKAVACKLDEQARTLTEKVEVKVTNKGRQTRDVVIREFAWRWPVWRLDGETKTSTRGGMQTLEYRAPIAPKSHQTVTYSVIYSW